MAFNTRLTYRRILRDYYTWNGASGTIDQERYDNYILHRTGRGHRRNGISTYAVVLKDYAGYNDIPTRKWQRVRTEKAEKVPLNANEIEMLHIACLRSTHIEEYLFIVDFLLGTAMRVDEFLNIRWCDVDLKEGTVMIMHAKGGKFRVINMVLEAQRAAMRWARYKGMTPAKARLDTSRVAPVGSKARVEQIVRDLAMRAGLDMRQVTPHLFRHTFISEMSRTERMSEKEIQLYAGHASPATTQRYEHYRQLDRTGRLKKMELFPVDRNKYTG